jgi:hypothetical protein
MNGTWKLDYGIHRGTMISRDCEVIPGLDGEQGCRYALAQVERYVASIGSYIWYAYAISPDGTRIKLCNGEPYR